MASTTPNQGRRLGELLQEQQEPFLLDVYLSEKGRKKKITYSYGSDDSGKISKSLTGYCLKRNVKRISMHSKLLKSIYTKLSFMCINPRVEKSDGINRNNQDLVEPDRQSPFNSIAGDVENASISSVITIEQTVDLKNGRQEEENTERNIPEKCEERSKQISPVSVLEEIPSSHDDSSLDHTRKDYENREGKHLYTPEVWILDDLKRELMLSASLQAILSHSVRKKENHPEIQGVQELVIPDGDLRQTKQLLLDYVREVLDAHRQIKRVKRNNQEFLSCEENGKLVSDSISAGERNTNGDENSSGFIDFDVLDFKVRWCDFETEKKDIVLDIGDCLCKDIMDELVIDLISFYPTNFCS